MMLRFRSFALRRFVQDVDLILCGGIKRESENLLLAIAVSHNDGAGILRDIGGDHGCAFAQWNGEVTSSCFLLPDFAKRRRIEFPLQNVDRDEDARDEFKTWAMKLRALEIQDIGEGLPERSVILFVQLGARVNRIPVRALKIEVQRPHDFDLLMCDLL